MFPKSSFIFFNSLVLVVNIHDRFSLENSVIQPLFDRFSRKLRSLSVPDTHGKESLKKYDFSMGDTFQIYSVKNRQLHEYVDLEGYHATLARSKVFKTWIRPILSELENKTFCLHLGDRPCDETVDGMPNLCFCKSRNDERNLRLIPDTYYQGQKGYVNNRHSILSTNLRVS